MLRSKISIIGLYNWDNTLFDGMVLPEGIDKETLVVELLSELGGFEILYPNPVFAKACITNWSKTRLESWRRGLEAFLAQYNPIHNFDRNEDYTDEGEGEGTGNGSSYTAAWNEGELQESSRGNSASKNKSKSHHLGHLYGNIGVTKTQEMIQDELELRQADAIHMIIDDFKCRFCILIY